MKILQTNLVETNCMLCIRAEKHILGDVKFCKMIERSSSLDLFHLRRTLFWTGLHHWNSRMVQLSSPVPIPYSNG